MTLVKLLVAIILGATLGFDREARDKPGGVKTNALVALATCAFIILVKSEQPSELGRVLSGIIGGVGFIGGGLILKKNNRPINLTGAVEIWISASIGIASGLEMWELAITITLLTILFSKVMRWIFPK